MVDNNVTFKEVRLLSLNFFMRPPLIKNNFSDYKEERLKYFIENVLPIYDIICLEEMFEFGSTRRQRLLEAAFKAGFEYTWTSPRSTIFNLSIDGGLVIISRFPIRSQDNITYPYGTYSDRLAAKGALYVKIELAEDQFVHLFSTHTQASYVASPPLSDKSVLVREQQFFLLRQFIDKVIVSRRSHEPIILVGDLNVNSRPPPDSSNPSSVKGDSQEYLNMIKILDGEGIHEEGSTVKYSNKKIISVRDMIKERCGIHPITFADVLKDDEGKIIPREVVLTSKDDLLAQASLDYILLIDDDPNINDSGKIRLDLQRTGVQEFFIKNQPFSQLSDHYGVSTILCVNL
ncbi:16332_t:CDS:2 [Acaulospora morrowiae]|uniref:sphingomyelin phosphodiesterase n=1 Tax=Acaulospora morrowiae TaxID=94023 RepID=A0A9N9N9G3_9GLOM|nr:16332_t:CDS:2 [Acaulospora morrowiae]